MTCSPRGSSSKGSACRSSRRKASSNLQYCLRCRSASPPFQLSRERIAPTTTAWGPTAFCDIGIVALIPCTATIRACVLRCQRRVPLVYLYGITPGRYVPVWPVYIVRDHPEELSFSVAVDAPYMPVSSNMKLDPASLEARRAYVTVETQRRLHQQGFRERVLRAYQEQCAVCRLHHEELLEAAHILPDGHPKGEPIVPNGLALCKLHHAAYDRNILGITPNLVVEIRLDILREVDGPMLQHGLQGFQGRIIHTPRSLQLRPRADLLAERYETFRKAS